MELVQNIVLLTYGSLDTLNKFYNFPPNCVYNWLNHAGLSG